MDIINFYEEIDKLKRMQRSWTKIENIERGESVADHSFATAMLAFLLSKDRKDINRDKVVKMMLVHDIAESHVGDILVDWKLQALGITAGDLNDGSSHGVTREEKLKIERAACEQIALSIGDEDIIKLWDEFENGDSPEAIFCRSIDKLELLLEIYQYEKRSGKERDLHFTHHKNIEQIKDNHVKQIYEELMRRRNGGNAPK